MTLTRRGFFSWRLPLWLCLAGIVVAALVDLACPARIDAGQVDNPVAPIITDAG